MRLPLPASASTWRSQQPGLSMLSQTVASAVVELVMVAHDIRAAPLAPQSRRPQLLAPSRRVGGSDSRRAQTGKAHKSSEFSISEFVKKHQAIDSGSAPIELNASVGGGDTARVGDAGSAARSAAWWSSRSSFVQSASLAASKVSVLRADWHSPSPRWSSKRRSPAAPRDAPST